MKLFSYFVLFEQFSCFLEIRYGEIKQSFREN